MHGGFADLSLNHLGTPPRAVRRSRDRTQSTITHRKVHQLTVRVRVPWRSRFHILVSFFRRREPRWLEDCQ
jgi:hypothetical protein